MNLLVPDLATTPRLQRFVSGMTEVLTQTQDEADILSRGKTLLAELVQQDDWLPEAFAQSNPDRYQQFLLYADPQDRFSVVSFVWGPGQATPIHDHTVWGLIGMLRGKEHSQPYAKQADGTWAPQGERHTLEPGTVEMVSPTIGDVHRVWNGLSDQTSISIHIYGANIGKVRRSVFLPDGSDKDFISGYSNPLPEWRAPLGLPVTQVADVLQALQQRREIALLDVREEDPFAKAHPLFASQLPLSRLEVEILDRVPRKETRIVLYDDGEGLVSPAGKRLAALDVREINGPHAGEVRMRALRWPGRNAI